MTVIDGKWIEARLTGTRGEKARLARAMGITQAKLSHTLAGERAVQPEEVLPVLRFFNESLGEGDLPPLLGAIREFLPDLEEDDQDAVADFAQRLARKNRAARR
jgi:hypothetical protein